VSGWLYLVLCLTIPAAWGTAMYFVFNAVDKRRRKFKKSDVPPVDYSI